ncbi:hypothetical protein DFJ73DRAFT_759689 [Zopfochytrium polystomum]|nr:hypothetical protein DFJ73DRAFT_759689 [Zopfochytrium polystomum]
MVAAIDLQKQLNFRPSDYLIVDQRPDPLFGGTWVANTYPGAACDVPSHLYSLSAAPNPDWTVARAPQREIQAHLQGVAARFGLDKVTWFGTEVVRCVWHGDATFGDHHQNRWHVELRHVDGKAVPLRPRTVVATAVISCVGQLNVPNVPALAGLGAFRGPVIHTARWNPSVDLRGKRVAVIGTGASAVQVVPEIAKLSGTSVSVFQRSPAFVAKSEDLRFWRVIPLGVPQSSPSSFGIPLLALLARRLDCVVHEPAAPPAPGKVTDPKLLEKVLPKYEFGCKRFLISDQWYPTLQRDNVTLITDPITELTASGVLVSRSGAEKKEGIEQPADVVILATGFKSDSFLHPVDVVGMGGVRLEEFWKAKGGPEAYKGVCVTGFPNLFFLYGPNTNPGHNSVIFMVESAMTQVTHLLRALFSAPAVRYINVTPSAEESFNTALQAFVRETGYGSSSCTSWYKYQNNGKVVNTWPASATSYWWITREVHAADFEQDAQTW